MNAFFSANALATVFLLAAAASPHLVHGADYLEGASGRKNRRASKRMRAAGGAWLYWSELQVLQRLFERCDPLFQRSVLVEQGLYPIPDGNLIQEFRDFGR